MYDNKERNIRYFLWTLTFYSLIIDIWLLNGTRAMIDLEEYDEKLVENDEKNPHIVICEVIFT
jgi:hypothetical protein